MADALFISWTADSFPMYINNSMLYMSILHMPIQGGKAPLISARLTPQDGGIILQPTASRSSSPECQAKIIPSHHLLSVL